MPRSRRPLDKAGDFHRGLTQEFSHAFDTGTLFVTLLDASKANPAKGGPSFSLSNRITRAVWIVTWALLASWTPSPLRPWRRWLLRRFGADIAPTAIIYGTSKVWFPAHLVMGDYATIGPDTIIYNMAPTRVGAYAIVSQGAQLCAGTHDIESPDFQLGSRPIAIGARAWIAADAFVGPGVTVGEGAVLGARGCAMRNLSAWTVYSGNPAQPLKERKVRFDDAPGNDRPTQTSATE